jgi:hypothetical protein
MTTSPRVLPRLLLAAATVLAVGCGQSATATPSASPTVSASIATGGPVGLSRRGSTSSLLDGLAPGSPVPFAVQIANTGDADAVITGASLRDASRDLRVEGAAAFPGQPNALGIGVAMGATPDVVDAVSGRSLEGATIGPTSMPGWTNGGWLVFLVSVPADGNYEATAVDLAYRVGDQEYTTTIPASLELCVGAAVPPGGSCPLPVR